MSAEWPLWTTCDSCGDGQLTSRDSGLRHGTAAAFLGVDDDLRYLTQRLRAVWPEVEIIVRADAGFGVPVMYEVCEELGLTYTFGIGMNSVLQGKCHDLLEKATTQYEATQEKQRLFMETDYQAQAWPCSRRVIIKCEAHQQGTNRRAVVTNRTDDQDDPQSIYDDYVQRGESENCNKELKCELCADRLSDHRFLAFSFRPPEHIRRSFVSGSRFCQSRSERKSFVCTCTLLR